MAIDLFGRTPGMWCYYVRAISVSGNSEWSNIVLVGTLVKHKLLLLNHRERYTLGYVQD